MIKIKFINLIVNSYYFFGPGFKKFLPKKLIIILKTFLNKNISNNEIFKQDKNYKYDNGVNLVGYIKSEMGLGQGCRLYAEAIDKLSINWVIISYDRLKNVKNRENVWINKISNQPKYNVNIIHINPDNMYFASVSLPQKLWTVPYNICVCLWELMELPNDWIECLEKFDEIWAPSKFIANIIENAVNKPVTYIPYGINVKNYDKYNRKYFGLREESFLFLVMYDVNSTFIRKNPQGAIEAFKMAFTENDQNVGIIIKINGVKNNNLDEINYLKNSLNSYVNVTFIEKILSRDETNSLINCSDSVISLHKSEGFGLVPAEAMFLGKPVVSTNWSATTEFINLDNSCPVNYTLVPIKEGTAVYKKGQIWAEPDIQDASEYMTKLVYDQDYYTKISNNAKKYITENFSIKNCSDRIGKRLNEINNIIKDRMASKV